jgi:hypothetical protein
LDLSSAAVRLKPVADAAVETVSHFLKYALVRDTERRSPPLSTVGGTRIEFSRGDVDGFRRSACTIVPSSWHQRIITLVTKITPINITTETSLTSLLDEAAKRPLLLEREDDIADEPDAEFIRTILAEKSFGSATLRVVYEDRHSMDGESYTFIITAM